MKDVRIKRVNDSLSQVEVLLSYEIYQAEETRDS